MTELPSKLQETYIFSSTIERLVKKRNLSYIDAILFYCDRTGLEFEVVTKMISNPLKLKLESEARKLHLIRDDREFASLWETN